MNTLSRSDISPIKMATNPPESIVNAGMRLINIHDNHIYEYLGNRWVKLRKAKREDYNNIPQLI